jgi:uncharacterized Fe-S cluster protein YjdI
MLYPFKFEPIFANIYMNKNMEKELIREYSNGEVTVVWKPYICMHAKYCWKELPEVFNPNARPWVNADGASSERIVLQVKRCPSGALSYFHNNLIN